MPAGMKSTAVVLVGNSSAMLHDGRSDGFEFSKANKVCRVRSDDA